MENMILLFVVVRHYFVLKPSRTAILFFRWDTKNVEGLAEITNQIENFRRAWKAGWW